MPTLGASTHLPPSTVVGLEVQKGHVACPNDGEISRNKAVLMISISVPNTPSTWPPLVPREGYARFFPRTQRDPQQVHLPCPEDQEVQQPQGQAGFSHVTGAVHKL